MLDEHLARVAERAAVFAAPFGGQGAARAAGLLHDIGKASAAFQEYVRQAPGKAKGPDHSTAGAREAEGFYGRQVGRMLAYAVAGHHAGLADFAELERRVTEKTLPDYRAWRDHAGSLPAAGSVWPERVTTINACRGFSQAFLTRMLFSCLVDADFLATEAFYDRFKDGPTSRGGFLGLAELEQRLDRYLTDKDRTSPALPINELRRAVRRHALDRAALAPGVFTLTVPTGGGKTLTSLAWALRHARLHGLRRIIYVIPYTSIIEQTASVFREAFATDEDVLEHHASFDWEARGSRVEEADAEGADGREKLRRATENWDAPVVVTTAVQFFESLFARKTSRCRKLHNIAQAAVVLDEAQTLPLRLLRPCMAALHELAANYGTSIVLCTATQPALRRCAGFQDENLKRNEQPQKIGFDIDDARELAPDPQALYASLKRVDVVRRDGKTSDAEIVARFREAPRMLCVVNNRRHARDLFDMLKVEEATAEGARHLTTLMCPVHRRAVLAEVRARLAEGRPVRLVATSLIEAGVDVDFPEVWRAVAGLDSIAQAAGRCNREGRLERGTTIVFDPEIGTPPRDMQPLIRAATKVFCAGLDPLSLAGVRAYFQEVYWLRGAEAMDAGTLGGEPWPILASIAKRPQNCVFDFETIAAVFRMIEDEQASVIVPYDAEASALLARVAAMERPRAADLRQLQQYAVSIPKQQRDGWFAAGVLRPVHEGISAGLLRFEDRAHYLEETGVDLREPERRDAASMVI